MTELRHESGGGSTRGDGKPGENFQMAFAVRGGGSARLEIEFRHEGCEHRSGRLVVTFRNTTLPVISHVAPAEGALGDRVVIHGGPFSALPGDVTVRFHGQTARVLEASETRLVVEVPAGASNGPLTVRVGENVSDDKTMFTVR